ncbi:hypothetical protein GO988_23345 [Hymenobacter sp. HMF4947]|uniref:Uncharacterized protein n=1 Tax=Hymenobacter ginkgonis TaxID=2682976 RepID=A0A7K1TLI3_9BACT|nr:hypothetical protein [Hymenobacter ginkgonis]MVN79279.1 hypothetical protein [Hymenobacter ginkgonis]
MLILLAGLAPHLVILFNIPLNSLVLGVAWHTAPDSPAPGSHLLHPQWLL